MEIKYSLEIFELSVDIFQISISSFYICKITTDLLNEFLHTLDDMFVELKKIKKNIYLI